jgi:hypothetical protein
MHLEPVIRPIGCPAKENKPRSPRLYGVDFDIDDRDECIVRFLRIRHGCLMMRAIETVGRKRRLVKSPIMAFATGVGQG